MQSSETIFSSNVFKLFAIIKFKIFSLASLSFKKPFVCNFLCIVSVLDTTEALFIKKKSLVALFINYISLKKLFQLLSLQYIPLFFDSKKLVSIKTELFT